MRAFAGSVFRFALALAVALPAQAALAQGGGVAAQHASGAPATRLAEQARKKAPQKRTAPVQPKAKPLERTPFTAEEQKRAVIPGIPDARFWGDEGAAFSATLGPKKGPWLALSGGGEGGAFGAGMLAGWSASGKRPDFALITGVSTGALIAPFAFAGVKYDKDLRESATGITAADVFELGGTPESLLDTWPLRSLIAKRITPELLADIAEQHRNGRRLFVVTTNLDAGRPVAWNVGAIATVGGERALKLIRDVLLASSSIPGIFPPVQIEVEADGRKFSEMHGDGTINAPFFIAPEPMLAGKGLAPFSGQEIYIVINGKLDSEFRVIERDRLSVLGRSISLALDFGIRSMTARVHHAAMRNGLQFNIAYVDPSFDHPWRGLFDAKYMQALFDHGFERAKNGAPFRNEAP
jgi:hypothetical protein